jgi:hypothetical protein
MAKIIVQDTQITVIKQNEDDYISLTDMLKAKDGEFFFSNWLRNRNTIEFLGIWERLMNPNFNCAEFDIIKSQAGLNRFRLSAKEWTEKTNAIGIISKAGRYGGTYAHKDIAFEFAMWISPEFKVYLIREFQRLKDAEQKQLGWTAKRELSKINYRIHTDAIKQNLIPEKVTALQASIIYAEEADVLNVRHVSRSPLAGSTSIIQVNNYYPFGGLLKEGEHHWDIQNRFYNGKEYDRMQEVTLI